MTRASSVPVLRVSDYSRARALWRACFHTGDLAAIGARHKGPARTACGMGGIEVTDPDGNTVCFGQDAE